MLGQRFENKVGSIINLSINFIAVCNFDKLKGESRKPIKIIFIAVKRFDYSTTLIAIF